MARGALIGSKAGSHSLYCIYYTIKEYGLKSFPTLHPAYGVVGRETNYER